MTFNEKIVKLRKLKGLTQDEFASAVGVSRQAVYKWESGQSYPEVAKLLEIKLLFNVSIDDLLDESYEIAVPEKKKKKAKVHKPQVAEEAKKEPAVEKAEEPKAEEPKAEENPTVAEEPKTEAKEEAKEEKKIGFFQRLFGRK